MKYSLAHKDLQEVFNFPTDKFSNCSIDNIESYRQVVSGPAYKDFTPRTNKGIKKDNIQLVLDWLAEEIFKYIHEECADFDDWHKKTCVAFCDKMEQCYGKILYGKAQKIVNMSFKYLFCFDDSQKYSAKFDKCHMALDQYTLEWFIRFVLTQEDLKHISISKIRETSWSKLACGDKNEEYSYWWIQEKIRDYIKKGCAVYKTEEETCLSPFLAEFYIWSEMQMHLAMEALYARGGKDKDFKKEHIPSKILKMEEFLSEFKKQYNA